MIKRMMLAAIAAAFAFAALPALASAEYHVSLSGGQGFTVAGGKANLVGTDAEQNTVEVTCESSGGSGAFQGNPSKTGTVKLSFHECHENSTGFGFSCNSPGDESGTITTTELTFHLVTVDHEEGNKHGILITGDPNHTHEGSPVFAEFECFIISTVVGGNGIVGTVTAPETDNASSTMTLSFEADSENPHDQTHQKVVGDETVYNLKSSVSGGPTTTASETATGVATLDSGKGTLTETK